MCVVRFVKAPPSKSSLILTPLFLHLRSPSTLSPTIVSFLHSSLLPPPVRDTVSPLLPHLLSTSISILTVSSPIWHTVFPPHHSLPLLSSTFCFSLAVLLDFSLSPLYFWIFLFLYHFTVSHFFALFHLLLCPVFTCAFLFHFPPLSPSCFFICYSSFPSSLPLALLPFLAAMILQPPVMNVQSLCHLVWPIAPLALGWGPSDSELSSPAILPYKDKTQ